MAQQRELKAQKLPQKARRDYRYSCSHATAECWLAGWAVYRRRPVVEVGGKEGVGELGWLCEGGWARVGECEWKREMNSIWELYGYIAGKQLITYLTMF